MHIYITVRMVKMWIKRRNQITHNNKRTNGTRAELMYTRAEI
jgi:hypothetical protein